MILWSLFCPRDAVCGLKTWTLGKIWVNLGVFVTGSGRRIPDHHFQG